MLIKRKVYQDLAINHEVNEEEEESVIESKILHAQDTHSGQSKYPIFNKNTLLEEAQKEAEAIIEKAKDEADNILQSVKSRASEEVKSFVHKKEKKINELEGKVMKELENLMNLQKNLVMESKPVIVDIAISLAQKLIDNEIKTNPQIVETLFRQTIDQMMMNGNDSLKAVFVVNPRDLEIAQKFINSMSQQGTQVDINLKEDVQIAPGSCIVETSSGSLDLNFSSQLELFREKVLSSEEGLM